MSYRVSLNLLPRLRTGEKVLYFKPWIWAASAKSLPSYRIFFIIPIVQEAGLYVTDRRVLIVYTLFRLVALEFSAWFEGKAESDDRERVKDVNVGRHSLCGSYLELLTYNPTKFRLRSHECRIRYYMSDPEPIYRAISEAM